MTELPTLQGTFNYRDAQHGGAVGWAHSRGITDGEIARLRTGLLVP